MSNTIGITDKSALALQERLERLMAKSKPSKRELIQQCFRDLYPKLEVYLSQGKSHRDLLAAFNELAQAKVCSRTFNDMLKAERDRRDAEGNPASCVSCGQLVNPMHSAGPPGKGAMDGIDLAVSPMTALEAEG